jgi:predicted HicB family RNase H-like nuclease
LEPLALVNREDMDNVLTHKGYAGSVEVSLEDDCLHGRVLFVNDIITYEGQTPAELSSAFKQAVDAYLDHCKAVGKQPDKACSGNLNVRLGPELHRKAATRAAQQGRTLNDFIARSVEAALDPSDAKVVLHQHVLVSEGQQVVAQVGGSAGQLVQWVQHGAATH